MFRIKMKERQKEDKATLQKHITENGKSIISDRMLHQMSTSGINFEHLKTAHKRNSEEGIQMFLSEKVEGHARVTNHYSDLAIHRKNIM